MAHPVLKHENAIAEGRAYRCGMRMSSLRSIPIP